MIALVVGVAGVGALVVALLGAGLVPLWIVAVIAGVLALATRLPRTLAIGLGVASFLILELGLLLVTPLVGLGLTGPHALVWGLVIAGAAFALRRTPPDLLRTEWRLALASLAGASVFLTTMVLSQVLPGALRLAWAMNGDTVNAMHFSREMVEAGGIDQVAVPQPTPLPFAMAAANMAGGRAGLPDAALLEHDVARTAQVWVLLLAILCVLVGATVARAARGATTAWAVTVTAVASAFPMLWYVVGVQWEFGFMNSAFAMVLLLSAWLCCVGGSTKPALGLAGVVLSALGLLAVWSPLIICVAPLALVMLVTSFRQIRRAGLAPLLLAALAVAAFLAYAIAFTVPTFLAQSDALGSNGGFPEVTDRQILVILAATVLSIVLAWQTIGRDEPRSALAVTIGFSIGLAYLLLQRQGADFGWGYYPAKFAWTTSVLLVTVATAFVVGVLARSTRPGRSRTILTLATGGALASLVYGAVLPTNQLPLPNVLAGTAFDNRNDAAELVFSLSGAENGQDMLWRTTIGDRWPNTWLLQLDVPDWRTSPVPIYATVPQLSTTQVCEIAGHLPGITIHTADPAAADELAQTCPDARYTVALGAY